MKLVFFLGLITFELKNLNTPESFIVDSETGEYYVSNINGSPTAKDGNGFITKLDANGKIIKEQFGKNLHAPKGMTIVGDILYVTDVDEIKGFNKSDGKLVYQVDLKEFGAQFLNDIICEQEGNLYVSDTQKDIIFKIEPTKDHTVSIFLKDKELAGPNGLVFDPQTHDLIIVSWNRGQIMKLVKGKLQVLFKDLGNLDGVDFDKEGNLYISDFTGGKIYRITQDKKVETIFKDLKTPADISIDREKGLLLIPSFDGDKIKTVKTP